VLGYLGDAEMTPVLEQLVTLSALPLRGIEKDFAMDSTGFSTCNYVRWFDHKWGREQKRQDWVKLHAMTGVVTNVITSVTVTPNKGAGTSDSAQFPELLSKTAENFTMREVSVDKAYSSKAHAAAVEAVGATPFIPFKANRIGVLGPQSSLFNVTEVVPGPEASAWVRMYHYSATSGTPSSRTTTAGRTLRRRSACSSASSAGRSGRSPTRGRSTRFSPR
jgi:Transposase DDE domain